MSNIARHNVGKLEAVVLTDGATEFGYELFEGTEPERIDELLAKAGRSAAETNFNALLIRGGDETILVDAGLRNLFGPAGGRLPQALEEAGVSPDDIDKFVITHLHVDHIGGAVTADGKPVFTKAEVLLADAERAFWSGLDSSSMDEGLQDMHKLALTVMSAYADQLTCVSADAEIATGVELVPLPGHTPGHVGIQVESEGEEFMYFTDLLHSQYLQLQDPSICLAFDTDKEVSRTTRRNLLDRLAFEGTICSGGHMLATALGRIEKRGSGYAFVGI